MKTKLMIFFALLSVTQIYSQSTDSLIYQISKNNISLKAFAKNIEADSIGNYTDIFLQNPEIGFNYLYGNQPFIGNRTEFSFIQSFDFPSAYIYKNQISDLKNEQLQYVYQQQYREVVLQALFIIADLTFYNMLITEFSKLHQNALKIATSYKLKFEVGEISIIEYNKAELNRLNSANRLDKLQIEKNDLLNELTGLNGNNPLAFDDTVFVEYNLPLDFDLWYSNVEKTNPLLMWLKFEVELLKRQEKLNSAMSLPKFKVGYTSEFSVGTNFQGVSFGISVPLWENKNKIKYAELKTEAIQIIENENKLKIYNSLKSLHSKAIALQKTIFEYEAHLQTFNNPELLFIAFDKGEINLIYYLMELSFYCDNLINVLEMKRDLNKTIIKLNQYQ